MYTTNALPLLVEVLPTLSQILLTIMSGAFALAGYHFGTLLSQSTDTNMSLLLS